MAHNEWRGINQQQSGGRYRARNQGYRDGCRKNKYRIKASTKALRKKQSQARNSDLRIALLNGLNSLAHVIRNLLPHANPELPLQLALAAHLRGEHGAQRRDFLLDARQLLQKSRTGICRASQLACDDERLTWLHSAFWISCSSNVMPANSLAASWALSTDPVGEAGCCSADLVES